ncbi:uncharacterized protein LOC122071061 [Macadamia integrifolia]|uniref:uncharacterized protein LOC122071061 n=1 Tax=Macadamia integrifolia TaxID=60698 RepID=UPI001C4E3936|nr:uncharacterized protein LOC122071061 [Macadamia integrifolia]
MDCEEVNGKVKIWPLWRSWDGLRKIWSFIGEADRWIVRDGQSIKFWYDRWLRGSRVVDLIVNDIQVPRRLSAMVSDFFEDGLWCLPLFASPQMAVIRDNVYVQQLPSIVFLDKRVWSLMESRRCTVWSGWEGLKVKNDIQPWYRLVWMKGLLPRFSIFGWRFAHDSLPTNDKVARQQFFDSQWYGFPSIEELFSWWERKARVISLRKIWLALVILIPFHIWSERNSRRFENLHRHHSLVVKAVLRDLVDFSTLVDVNVKTVTELLISRRLQVKIAPIVPRRIIEVIWQCPLLDCFKLNIDGCSLGNPGCAGAGGIIRD